MTRFEKYSNSIALLVGVFLILLCGLIAITMIAQFTPEKPVAKHPVFAPHVPEPTSETLSSELEVATTSPTNIATVEPTAEIGTHLYARVVGSCPYNFSGDCVRVHSSPGTSAPTVAKLRNDMVLRISDDTPIEKDGHRWYRVMFDEALQYPERNTTAWYVASEFLDLFRNVGTLELNTTTPTTSPKRIVVDRSEQTLVAYDGTTIFMSVPISTGLDLTPTPRGVFRVFRMMPSRYMQGPLRGVSDQYYDLPGVPWNLYFTAQGAVIHGAYWHNSFGKPYSHGCVNLIPENAEKLYKWADLGISVTIQD